MFYANLNVVSNVVIFSSLALGFFPHQFLAHQWQCNLNESKSTWPADFGVFLDVLTHAIFFFVSLSRAVVCSLIKGL